jgi:aspartyl-tRNA(Asn)/glutamyl-tRNA(Gln) amidotransferase subunit C
MKKEDVLKLAHLARLTLSDEEADALVVNLSSILEYVKQLDSIDTANIEPMSHVHGFTNIFREDVVEPSLPIQEALQNAPDTSGRFIRVPIIIDQEG